MIEDLVQELVDDDEVLLQRVLVELAEVGFEQIDELAKERKRQHRVGVGARHRDDVDILLALVHEGARPEVDDGHVSAVLAVDDLRLESRRHLTRHVVAVLALHQHLTAQVHEVQRAEAHGGVERGRHGGL